MLWSVVTAFYNEEAYLLTTLTSLAAQTEPFRLILVDNLSTDQSLKIAQDFAAQHPHIETTILHESRPGHPHALEAGIAAVNTRYVALTDADTVYPPDYLARATRLIQQPGTVGAFAVDFYGDRQSWQSRLARMKFAMVTRLMAKQCHTGSYGQCYDVQVLRDVGGISTAIWPYVLHDHEIVQRVLHRGRIAYDTAFYCLPSDRRGDGDAVRWTVYERMLYHFLPFPAKDWFFNGFLGPRFAQRGLSYLKIRDRDWDDDQPQNCHS